MVPGGRGSIGRAGAYLLRATACLMPSAFCFRPWRALFSAATGRAVHQLDRPYAEWPDAEPEDLVLPEGASDANRRSSRTRMRRSSPCQWLGGFAESGRGYAIVWRVIGKRRSPGPCHRRPGLWHGRHRFRVGLHLVAEQPRESPHALCERSVPDRPPRPYSCATTRPAQHGRRTPGPMPRTPREWPLA